MTPTTATPSAASVGTVASELRELRARAGMTRAQVAALAGCSLSALGNLEAGAIPRRSAVLERVRALLEQLIEDLTA